VDLNHATKKAVDDRFMAKAIADLELTH